MQPHYAGRIVYACVDRSMCECTHIVCAILTQFDPSCLFYKPAAAQLFILQTPAANTGAYAGGVPETPLETWQLIIRKLS